MDKLLLKNQLCFPLYLCSKEIIRKYTPLLNKLDLTYTQYIVMMYLWENKECNVKELGKTLLLDSNTLTPLLKKLESNTIISITEKGLELKERALAIPDSMIKCVNLSDEEAQTLYKILYKVLYNIEKEEN